MEQTPTTFSSTSKRTATDNEESVNCSVEEGTGHTSCKIPKLNEQDPTFQFPSNPQLLQEEMVVAKHPLDRVPGYIPFRTAGNGRILITKIFLDQLYEKEPSEKVSAAVFVEVPSFRDDDSDDDSDDDEFDVWKAKLQEYWRNEIGSFLQALERIGERKTFIVEPFWHFSLNWEGLKTICTISNIAHDVYIQEERDEEYEFHFDSKLPRSNPKTEERAQLTDSVQLADLKITWEFKSDTKVNTTVWIIDLEINYCHLNEEETNKVFPSYYEYSSDDDQFESKQHDVSNEDNCKDEYKHGTIMCKIISAIASRQTTIHFVKCGNSANHIERCLSYVLLKARELKIKRNVILITLGSLKFRITNIQLSLYILHEKLHRKGFLFICSAGNVKFSQNNAVPEIPQYPVSFFANCLSCFVVGAHGLTLSKLACIPFSFGSCGCCTPDTECTFDESFKQGVHTWAIGEAVLVPKTKYQDNDRLIHGTSVAAAVVAASITLFLPKLLNRNQNFFGGKKMLAKKLKELLETSSDIFLCPKHGTRRNLIFNSKNCMVNLGYRRNLCKQDPELLQF